MTGRGETAESDNGGSARFHAKQPRHCDRGLVPYVYDDGIQTSLMPFGLPSTLVQGIDHYSQHKQQCVSGRTSNVFSFIS